MLQRRSTPWKRGWLEVAKTLFTKTGPKLIPPTPGPHHPIPEGCPRRGGRPSRRRCQAGWSEARRCKGRAPAEGCPGADDSQVVERSSACHVRVGLGRGLVPKRRMEPLAVVEDLDVVVRCSPSIGEPRPLVLMGPFLLEDSLGGHLKCGQLEGAGDGSLCSGSLLGWRAVLALVPTRGRHVAAAIFKARRNPSPAAGGKSPLGRGSRAAPRDTRTAPCHAFHAR